MCFTQESGPTGSRVARAQLSISEYRGMNHGAGLEAAPKDILSEQRNIRHKEIFVANI